MDNAFSQLLWKFNSIINNKKIKHNETNFKCLSQQLRFIIKVQICILIDFVNAFKDPIPVGVELDHISILFILQCFQYNWKVLIEIIFVWTCILSKLIENVYYLLVYLLIFLLIRNSIIIFNFANNWINTISDQCWYLHPYFLWE